MINLVKNNISSFCIQIDVEGISELLKYLKNLNKEGKDYLQVGYLGGKNKLRIKLDMNADEMRIRKDMISINMDCDEIEYFAERLEAALKSECFYPAEICERMYKNNYATVYCEVI